MHAGEQPAQRAMIGLVEILDAAERVIDRDALVVDFLRVADHARDGAEPAGDPHRTGVGKRRQPALEHARIELVGLAVDVDEAAREMRPHQRIAARHHAEREIVDEAVLGAAQGRQVEPGALQERARIDAAGVRRVEQHRSAPCRGLDDLERRIELVLRLGHGTRVLGNFDGGLSGGFESWFRLDSHCPRPDRRCQASFHRLFTSIPANGWRGAASAKSRKSAAKRLPGGAKDVQARRGVVTRR